MALGHGVFGVAQTLTVGHSTPALQAMLGQMPADCPQPGMTVVVGQKTCAEMPHCGVTPGMPAAAGPAPPPNACMIGPSRNLPFGRWVPAGP